jgi:cytochrome P450
VSYDPFSRETQLDPYPGYRWLLEHAPVYFNPDGGFYALSRHADVQAAFRDWRTFSSSAGVTLDALLEITGPSFLTMDPPRHELLRELVRDPFRPKAIAELEARVAEHAANLLDELGDEADLVAELASRLPVLVICDLMGFPTADEPALRQLSDLVLERVPDETSTPRAARDAALEMRAYFAEHLARRRRDGGDDLVTRLALAEGLTEDEQIGISFLLFEAGNSTTKSLLANALLLLAEHPAEREWLEANPAGTPGAIEEILRFESPVQNMGRVTTAPVELHGETIPAGARVLLVIGAANRDPRVFPDPDRFDLARAPRRTLAFGEGIHHCLGAPLARLEARVALRLFLERVASHEVLELERFHDVTQRNLKRLRARLVAA